MSRLSNRYPRLAIGPCAALFSPHGPSMAQTAAAIRDSVSQREDGSDPSRFSPVGTADITQPRSWPRAYWNVLATPH